MIVVLTTVHAIAYAQLPTQPTDELATLVAAKQYPEALEVLKQKAAFGRLSPLDNYYFGLVYFNTSNQKSKALKYLQAALAAEEGSLQTVPADVYYYLGRSYHYKFQFLRALDSYNEYIEAYPNGVPPINDVQQQIRYTENALTQVERPRVDYTVSIMDFPVNTSYNDYAPLISSNGNLLIMGSDRPINTFNLVYGDQYPYLPDELKGESEDVYMATRRGISWGFPEPQSLANAKVVPLSLLTDAANMSMLLQISENSASDGDIYISDVKRQRWTSPKKIEGAVNSKNSERGACFGANGNIIYFASDRPGGFGGFDIYKAYKTGKNQWSNPVNLGSTINSAYDEVNPFLHPDNKTLYFSSNSHKSIGGFDIFSSEEVGAQWSEPISLEYPLNSLYDEEFFVQSPDRKYSYITSNRNQGTAVGQKDIIMLFRPEEKVPRTTVTGTITALQNGENVPLSLEVIDLNTDTPVRYVYDPDPVTGKFFAIVLPEKNYMLSVKNEGREIYRINIDIPKNSYNYELHQQLDINEVSLKGQPIGQQILSNSSSYTVTRLSEVEEEAPERNLRYDMLESLVEVIIDRTDVEGLSNLNELERPVEYKQDEQGLPLEYYTTLDALVERAIEQADVELLTSLEKMRGDGGNRTIFLGGKGERMIASVSLFFNPEDYQLNELHKADLQEVAALMGNHSELRMELAWYPRSGESAPTEEPDVLATKRIDSIKQFLNERYIANYRYKIVNGLSKHSGQVYEPGEVQLRFYQSPDN
jgi:hypothetical protein